jgi:hypothetical protein
MLQGVLEGPRYKRIIKTMEITEMPEVILEDLHRRNEAVSRLWASSAWADRAKRKVKGPGPLHQHDHRGRSLVYPAGKDDWMLLAGVADRAAAERSTATNQQQIIQPT